MDAYNPADHAMGLELQLEELTEQRKRATVQGRTADVERLEREIAAVQAELVATAEALAESGPGAIPPPEFHDADKLSTP